MQTNYEIFYTQGRYIRAFELVQDEELRTMIQKESNYPIINPEYLIQQFRSCNDSKKEFSGSYDSTWQAVVEESIDIFETMPRTNCLNENDAYQILRTVINDFVKLTPSTKAYVQIILEKIHNSIELMDKILSSSHTCRHNIHYIDQLMQLVLESNFDSLTIKNITLKYLNNLQYDFDLGHETEKKILANHDPLDMKTDYDVQITRILVLPIARRVSCSTYNYVSEFYSLETLHQVLINNLRTKCPINSTLRPINIELAVFTCQNKSTVPFYELEDAAKILLAFQPTSPFDEQITFVLANLVLENKIDFITDESIIQMLKQMKIISYGAEQVRSELIEKFYLAGRCSDPQKLTIANNTNLPMQCTVRLRHDRIESFTLEQSEQKIYTGLRESQILNVSITIKFHGHLFEEQNYIDIHSYVTVYIKSGKFKFSVYYEPDPFLDNLEPTSGMVGRLARIMKDQYDKENIMYPGQKLDDFVTNTYCLIKSNWYNKYVSDLNSVMRPERLKKAINMIFNIN